MQGKFLRSVTAHEVVGGDLFLCGRLFPAEGHRILAAGMKMATRRSVGRIGDFALEDDPFGTKARVRLGDRGHQRLGIGMSRRGEQLLGRRGLHDPADVHHRDPRADVLDDAQVVRDEEIGEPEPFLKLEEEVQDLRLDRHIQRRDGFVRDDQPGAQGKRAREDRKSVV